MAATSALADHASGVKHPRPPPGPKGTPTKSPEYKKVKVQACVGGGGLFLQELCVYIYIFIFYMQNPATKAIAMPLILLSGGEG